MPGSRQSRGLGFDVGSQLSSRSLRQDLLPHSDPLAQGIHGNSALMLAAMNDDQTSVELLLPHSNPLALNFDGHSALMLAAIFGYEDCVKLLLPHSDFSATNLAGLSAAHIASSHGYLALAVMIDAYALAKHETILLTEHVSVMTASAKRLNARL